jgi:hypothetical protein
MDAMMRVCKDRQRASVCQHNVTAWWHLRTFDNSAGADDWRTSVTSAPQRVPTFLSVLASWPGKRDGSDHSTSLAISWLMSSAGRACCDQAANSRHQHTHDITPFTESLIEKRKQTAAIASARGMMLVY